MRNPCDICSFKGSYFICWHIYVCVKCVFNAWYSCEKCTNLRMNELCTIFIIYSSQVKLWCTRLFQDLNAILFKLTFKNIEGSYCNNLIDHLHFYLPLDPNPIPYTNIITFVCIQIWLKGGRTFLFFSFDIFH
jgi:hypothetical protein